MDYTTIILVVVTLILGFGFAILALRYVSLAGSTEFRARQMFEEWKSSALERDVPAAVLISLTVSGSSNVRKQQGRMQ